MVTLRQFGPIPGVLVGRVFNNRQELSAARVHRPTQAGISGSSQDGSDSIVLNGGYADDEDHGDVIVYTGHGGQDGRGRQVRDQEVSDSGNAALKISFEEQLPVRVIRGSGGDPKWSPPKGYRYDGLYLVSRFWEAYGLDGYKVCRYLLERLEQTKVIEATDGTPADRTTTIAERLLRNSALAQRLKKIYDWTCQMCGTRIESPSGPYAEAAHIKPLGRPDDGPDVEANILCLCPNHHKLLDSGGVVVDREWKVIHVIDGRETGVLTRNTRHRLTQEYREWHRERWLGI